MKIGELSKVSGASRDTIRFYEDKGLLANVTRPNKWNNYKDYGEENIKRLQIIAYLKQFSFTLKECKEMLDLRDESPDNCIDKVSFLKTKLEVIESKITALQETRDRLIQLIS